eukprot:CAMPEP_0115149654 /NCGR_PEP_ID=MMETSP0227-20121206/64581_1 /TAXON_ID=89957 /ORGANISM="Polarella glacialis, Strain CCMP 1383" /LENGTH=70 /DNA_ID=CAMNT_0002559887 /DNA_START=102 /DNA_END=314 /DNA_ORIENTATION=+
MTAAPGPARSSSYDEGIGIPAWLISKDSGTALFAQLGSGAVFLQVQDDARKPPLGDFQADDFGVRDHQTE